jgi:hypothetical protein
LVYPMLALKGITLTPENSEATLRVSTELAMSTTIISFLKS